MFVCLGIVIYTSIYIRRLIKQSQFEELQKYNDLVAITINAIQSIIFIHLLTPVSQLVFMAHKISQDTLINPYFNS